LKVVCLFWRERKKGKKKLSKKPSYWYEYDAYISFYEGNEQQQA